jgi:hypothetical protein
MNSTASKQAHTNCRFIVAWHYAADGEVLGFQRCQFATKKAAKRTLDRIVQFHPEWNAVMGQI